MSKANNFNCNENQESLTESTAKNKKLKAIVIAISVLAFAVGIGLILKTVSNKNNSSDDYKLELYQPTIPEPQIEYTAESFEDYDEYVRIVKDMSEKVWRAEYLVYSGQIPETPNYYDDREEYQIYDLNNCINFVVEGLEDEKIKIEGYDKEFPHASFAKITDERFDTAEEVQEYLKCIFSKKYYDFWYKSNFNDFSDYSIGDTLSPFSVSRFITYNEKLYYLVMERASSYVPCGWTDDPIRIYDVTESSFIAERPWSDNIGINETYDYHQFYFIKDEVTGEWRIDEYI